MSTDLPDAKDVGATVAALNRAGLIPRMMPKVSPEKVKAALERLRATGQTPSLRSIREQVGGGSFGTIGALWRQIREAEAAGTVPAPTQPPEVAALAVIAPTALAQVREAIRQQFAEQLDHAVARAAEAEARASELGSLVTEQERRANALESALVEKEEDYRRIHLVMTALQGQVEQIGHQLAAQAHVEAEQHDRTRALVSHESGHVQAAIEQNERRTIACSNQVVDLVAKAVATAEERVLAGVNHQAASTRASIDAAAANQHHASEQLAGAVQDLGRQLTAKIASAWREGVQRLAGVITRPKKPS